MRPRRFQFILMATAATSLLGLAVPQAQADIFLLSQPPDGTGKAGVAQIFPDVDQFSTKLFDDFVVPDGVTWCLNRIIIYGQERGDPTLNQDVRLTIATAPGFFEPTLLNVGAGAGTEMRQADTPFGPQDILVFDNLGAFPLQPGRYWLSAWVVRDITPGGEWFWDRILEPGGGLNGFEHRFQNPLGGFQRGTSVQEGHVLFGDVRDLAFTIEGIVKTVPEPSTTVLFVISALGLIGYGWRPRRRAAGSGE